MDFNFNNPIVLGDPLAIRASQLTELETLVRIASQLCHMDSQSSPTHLHPQILSRIENGITTALDGLFPHQVDFDEEVYNRAMSNSHIIQKNEPLSDYTATVATTVREFTTWDMIEPHIHGTQRAARGKWDNTLNQEYIVRAELSPGVFGYIKHYRSYTPEYYKKVEHTFTPTDEDTKATDWYII